MKKFEKQVSPGNRLYDVEHDPRSSSSSTMLYRGRIEGSVSAAEIVAAMGSGSFGHKPPRIDGDRFTYVKITD